MLKVFKRKNYIIKILTFCFICIAMSCCSIILYANNETLVNNTHHNVGESVSYNSWDECENFDFMTASYDWVKGGVFARDRCEVFMQNLGSTSEFVNEVSVNIWHNGELYDSKTESASNVNISFNLKGKLWVGVEKVEANFSTSHEAVEEENWNVVGD